MRIFQSLEKPFRRHRFKYEYKGDNFAVRGKNVSFMENNSFSEAYAWSIGFTFNGQSTKWTDADLRWRAHICLWAAKNSLKIDGDLVECGVDSAILSGTIVRALNFKSIDRKFFLFDTYSGIPDLDGLTDGERAGRAALNSDKYFDSFEFVTHKMAEYPNVSVVRGILPGTLDVIIGRKIAYLSVDLNNAISEKAVIDRLWPQLSHGANVVIDDYAFSGHEEQYKVWNKVAEDNGVMVATLPTGQGLLIKP